MVDIAIVVAYQNQLILTVEAPNRFRAANSNSRHGQSSRESPGCLSSCSGGYFDARG